MVEASHAKELQSKETIQKLKEEITGLNKLIEKGGGVSEGQEYRWTIYNFIWASTCSAYSQFFFWFW